MRKNLPTLLALALTAACGEVAPRDAPRDDAASAEATDSARGGQRAASSSADSGRVVGDIGGPGEGGGVVLFFGNSLTAGFGVPLSAAFPARIQARIDSAGLPFRVVEAGVSGETSAGGARRIDWILARQPVDVFVLELGGNDALRGLDPDAMERNLQTIIDAVRRANPDVEIVVAGMLAPPNLGERYTSPFRRVFMELAERNDATLIPFLLEGVGGVAELNLADGIHPTAAGHARVADTVWRYLEPVLREIAVREARAAASVPVSSRRGSR
ncbi:MAG: arylesterase [Longimicrobiales bacterium]